MHVRRVVIQPLLCAAVSCLISASLAQGATLVADGSAADWGFSVADNNASTFVSAFGINIVAKVVEDSDDLAGDDGFVGPNLGGQNYDAEAIAVALQGSSLFVIIVSGQRPDNGLARYAPGDLHIMTTGGHYGLEIGGGAGGGAGTMLVDGEAGSTYALDSGGFTTVHAAADPAQTAGSIWLNPGWIFDTIPPLEQTQIQIAGGGTLVGDATLRFTRDIFTTQHSIIEMEIPLSLFGGQTINGIAWYPACGNDVLSLSIAIVPEPATITLALVAAAGLLPVLPRRRRAWSGYHCESGDPAAAGTQLL